MGYDYAAECEEGSFSYSLVNVDDDVDMDIDVGLGPVSTADAPIDSMHVANITDNDGSWTERMRVNNEPLNYEFPTADDNEDEDDSDEPEMERPLDDDLCTAQMMARSVVANLQFAGERFSSAAVQTGFSVGMVFETKEKLLQQLSEWSIKHAVSYKPIKSNKTKYTAICNVDVNCPWRIHAIVSKKSHSGRWEIKKYPSEHTCVNPTVNSEHKPATSGFLATKVMSFVKADLDITAGTVQVLVADQLYLKISYMKAW